MHHILKYIEISEENVVKYYQCVSTGSGILGVFFLHF